METKQDHILWQGNKETPPGLTSAGSPKLCDRRLSRTVTAVEVQTKRYGRFLCTVLLLSCILQNCRAKRYLCGIQHLSIYTSHPDSLELLVIYALGVGADFVRRIEHGRQTSAGVSNSTLRLFLLPPSPPPPRSLYLVSTFLSTLCSSSLYTIISSSRLLLAAPTVPPFNQHYGLY